MKGRGVDGGEVWEGRVEALAGRGDGGVDVDNREEL
jgi:hypothetical protein